MRPEIEQVVQLKQRKNPKSLEEALELLPNTVFSFSMKVRGQRQDAEDTTQEVLLKSVPYLPKFDSPKALMVWLFKVAKNRCLMSRRRSKFAPNEALSLEELMPDRKELEKLSGNTDGTPETSLMRRENARSLREAVRAKGTRRTGPGPRSPASCETSGSNPRAGRERRCKEMFAELSNYLDVELVDSLCDALGKHMDGCEPCKAFLSSLEKSIQQCRKAPNESPDPGVAASLRRELLSEYRNVMATLQARSNRRKSKLAELATVAESCGVQSNPCP